MSKSFANIAVTGALHNLFSYIIPEGLNISEGMRVRIPWRSKDRVGYVMEVVDEAPQDVAADKIKPIIEILDADPIFSTSLLKLIRWMSSYYLAPIGEICRLALPNRLNKPDLPKSRRISSPHLLHPKDSRDDKIILNAEQHGILSEIEKSLDDKQPGVHLVHGITGSGKTEVYLRLFKKIALTGRSGICLVPEIALTPQLASRFYDHFGERVAIYHSSMTDAQRYDQWLKVKRGEISVVVGTRSAIFAPLVNPGLIVVDEEHDSSFKQSTGVAYSARDVAVVRANIEGITAVLGSATPSVESFHNSRSGKYKYHFLSSRPNDSKLPSIEILDLKCAEKIASASGKTTVFTRDLIEEIDQTLKRSEQALVFLNRRGFANSFICRDCGYLFECPNCHISLTYHKGANYLRCHYCDYTIAKEDSCIKCKGSNLGLQGLGTERIEEDLKNIFPDARIARLDSDTAQNNKFRHKVLSDMKKGKIDILIGTQIISKGHDFANLTLVGVVNADTGLNFPDFRAAENTFQMITQVSGRAGRRDKAGRVLIQSYNADHYALKYAAAHDFDGFFNEENRIRKELSYPPFSRLINIRLSGNNEERVESASHMVKDILKESFAKSDLGKGVKILGPAPAPLNKVRGKWRWQILIKTLSVLKSVDHLSRLRGGINLQLPSGVKFTIDVDPVDMM
ncbi:MAG: primosomal protein N' [Pseudomonadota bacterium]